MYYLTLPDFILPLQALRLQRFAFLLQPCVDFMQAFHLLSASNFMVKAAACRRVFRSSSEKWQAESVHDSFRPPEKL